MHLPIEHIRKDGDTQHRTTLTASIISDYAALMSEGAEFPPVTVWYDGENYWLTDGFHRVAAADQLGTRTISADVHRGSLIDAQWHSYRANAEHGLQRTPDCLRTVIQKAMQHPRAATLSNVELARHLNLPEATLRRWRKRLSSSGDDDRARVVTRGRSTYVIKTRNIGRHRSERATKSRDQLREELTQMKRAATSCESRRLLVIIGNWAFGTADTTDALAAIEHVINEFRRRDLSRASGGGS